MFLEAKRLALKEFFGHLGANGQAENAGAYE